MSAAARFCFQFMGAKPATKAKALQEHRIIEKRQCPTVRAMGHKAFFQLENGRLAMAFTVEHIVGCHFLPLRLGHLITPVLI